MRSLSLKLVVAFLFVGLTGIILMVLVTRWSTYKQFDSFIFNRDREGLITNLEDYYSTNGDWDDLSGVSPPIMQPQFAPQPGPREWAPYTLLDNQNVVVIAGRGFSPGQKVSKRFIKGSITIEVDDEVVGYLIVENNAFRRGLADSAFLEQITMTLLLSAVGAIVLALFLGILLARTLTEPLRELTIATRAVTAGDLDQTVPVRSNDELGELADSFNIMSAELSRSQHLRRQMTADIAHELRTPISVILGHADAIEEGVLPASEETLEIIRDEASRLERMVEDLRVLSQADAGELQLDLISTEIGPLLIQASRTFHQAAARSEITLSTKIMPDMPPILIDPDRMSMVLGNLLNNAIRFTPEGGQINLSAQCSEDHVNIVVSDTGPGMPPEELSRVFERFYRVDKSRDRDMGGSGLGLAIAKSIVEQHGGTIHAKSVVGEGTSFVILLPAHTDKAI